MCSVDSASSPPARAAVGAERACAGIRQPLLSGSDIHLSIVAELPDAHHTTPGLRPTLLLIGRRCSPLLPEEGCARRGRGGGGFFPSCPRRGAPKGRGGGRFFPLLPEEGAPKGRGGGSCAAVRRALQQRRMGNPTGCLAHGCGVASRFTLPTSALVPWTSRAGIKRPEVANHSRLVHERAAGRRIEPTSTP
jgi:hypothetical protein